MKKNTNLENDTNLSLAEQLKTSAVLWKGITNKGTDLLIEKFNIRQVPSIYWYLIKVEQETVPVERTIVKLYGTKEALMIQQDIFDTLKVINPEYEEYTLSSSELSEFPSDTEVTGDYNAELSSRGIAVLSEGTVLKELAGLNIDYSSYKYTDCSVTESSNVVALHTDKGLDKYPQAVLDYSIDLELYKNYSVDPFYEEMFDEHIGVLLMGEPGTGKSFAAKIVAAHQGIPCCEITFSEGTDEDKILGSFIPSEDGKSQFRFQRSLITLYYQYGGYLIINEINLSREQVQAMMMPFLDGSESIQLPNGEVVKRHPNFRLIATMNPGFAGTNSINEALVNRFFTWYVKPLTGDELKERLIKSFDYHNNIVLDALCDAYKGIKDIFSQQSITTSISYRNVADFLKDYLAHPDRDISNYFNAHFVSPTVANCRTPETLDYDLSVLNSALSVYETQIKDAINRSTGSVEEGSIATDILLSDNIDLADLGATFEDLPQLSFTKFKSFFKKGGR